MPKKIAKIAPVKALKDFFEGHQTLKNIAIYTGVVPAIYAGTRGIYQGIGKAYNAAAANSRLKDVYQQFPNLKDENPDDVRTAFNTLNKINPTFASDPLIAGTWVRRVMDSDVGTGIMVDPQTASQVEAKPSVTHLDKILGLGAKGLGKSMENTEIDDDTPTYESPSVTSTDLPDSPNYPDNIGGGQFLG